MDQERSNFTVGANAPVVLVFAQSHRIANADFESARRMLRGSFEQFPDLYFAFVTNDGATFRQLTNFVRPAECPYALFYFIKRYSSSNFRRALHTADRPMSTTTS